MRAEEEAAGRLMDRRTEGVQQAVAAEARRYIDALELIAASLGAHAELTNATFLASTAPLRTMSLRGAAVVSYLVPAQSDEIAEVQAYWRQHGQPGLTLRPSGNGSEHVFGVFQQPLDGSNPNPGGDAAQVAEAWTALQEARRYGEPVISQPYVLVRDRNLPPEQRQRSFVLVRPVYAAERGAFLGWVAMSLRGGDFMDATLRAEQQGLTQVTLRVADHNRTVSQTLDVTQQRFADAGANLRRTVDVQVADQRWRLTVEADSERLAGAETYLDEGVLMGGIPLTVLLAALVYVLATGRSRARARVDAATAELRASKQQLRELNNDLERRVAERTEQLAEANAELESFSYSVSHDLRAPLRAVDGFAKMLALDYDDRLDDEARRYLQRIRNGAQQMGQLIDGLLAFSRLQRQSLVWQPVRVEYLVREVWEELGASDALADRDVTLKVGELPVALGDPRLVRHVVSNLLGNAVKYTRNRATARVEVGHDEAAYFVRDNGAGFDMRYADKLFKVFQRLHRAEEYEGTGIGLALAQRIVQRHGGRMWADGAPDRGATFYFTLPAADAGAGHIDTEESHHEAAADAGVVGGGQPGRSGARPARV
jgi:signal transduction histidine kinase